MTEKVPLMFLVELLWHINKQIPKPDYCKQICKMELMVLAGLCLQIIFIVFKAEKTKKTSLSQV